MGSRLMAPPRLRASGQLVRRAGITLLLTVMVFTGIVASFAQAGLGVAHASGLSARPGTTYAANTLAQFRATGNGWGQARPSHTATYNPALEGPLSIHGNGATTSGPSAVQAQAQPLSIVLDQILLNDGSSPVGPTLTYTSSDGLLSLQLAERSLNVSQATVVGTPSLTKGGGVMPGMWRRARGVMDAGIARATTISTATGTSAVPVPPFTLVLQETQGTFHAQTTQIARFSLQVHDSLNQPLSGVTLLSPIGMQFHVSPQDLAGLDSAGIVLAWPGTANAAQGVAAQTVPVSYDAGTGMLAATTPLSLPTSSTTKTAVPSRKAVAAGATSPANASPLDPGAGPMMMAAGPSDVNAASSEHFVMNGNQGDLGFAVPLSLPPAAGGLVPPLQLVYSSAGTNGRHSRQGPAPWVGDGWDLSLGSITYDSSTGLFYLNGIGGVSEPLLCCTTDGHGNSFYVPHHHPEIEITTSDNSANPQTTGKWFRVRTPDGMEYDLGRTGGSLRSTVTFGSLTYYEWDVSEVLRLAPNTAAGYLQAYAAQYWQDTATSGGVTYTRDAALKEVDYNYGPVTSSNPAAFARILFNIHWPDAAQSAYGGLLTATQYSNDYNCTQPAQGSILYTNTLRCDDPVAQSGWEAAPLTMTTLTLDSINVQVFAGSAWQTVRQYQFNYQASIQGAGGLQGDTGMYLCTNDLTGGTYACSGEHLLGSVQEIPYQGGGAAPSRQPVTFIYSKQLKSEYHDSTIDGFDGRPYDAQTYWQYLTSYWDQQTGAQMSAAYTTGWGNTNGVPSGSVTDPTTCAQLGITPCFPTNNPSTWPDDRQWPRQLVTSITDIGDGSTVTNFAYQLNQPCGGGCTRDTWIPAGDFNFVDYYDEVFTGFAQVTVTHPDNSTSVTKYDAGDGWSTNDSDMPNINMGQPVTEDAYQSGTSGTPLQEAQHTYANSGGHSICPATSGSNPLTQGPYEMCLQFEQSRTTYTGGGQGSSPAVPSVTQTWAYNTSGNGDDHFYLQLTSETETANDLLADSLTAGGASYGTTVPLFTTAYTYVINDGASAPYFLVTTAAQTALTDNAPSGSTLWACQRQLYDGQPYVTGQSSGLVDGLVTETDTYADGNCADSAAKVPSGAGYDQYGQPLVSTTPDGATGVAGDGTRGVASHVGCTPSTTPLVAAPATGPYSTCTTYNSTSTSPGAYLTQQTNAGNQSTNTTWDEVQGVTTATTDANNITTTDSGPVYEYNLHERPGLGAFEDVYTQTIVPPDGTSGNPAWTSRTYTYSFCAGSITTTPCLEVDTVHQLDGAHLVVKREFYDRDGGWWRRGRRGRPTTWIRSS